MAEEERIVMSGPIPPPPPDLAPEPVDPPKRFHLGPPMPSCNKPENGSDPTRKTVYPPERDLSGTRWRE
jgi:hypothetical protein